VSVTIKDLQAFKHEGKRFAMLTAYDFTTARIVDDPTERRTILERVARAWRRTDVDRMVAQSPLIEVILDDRAA
jgi:hypothetical protein